MDFKNVTEVILTTVLSAGIIGCFRWYVNYKNKNKIDKINKEHDDLKEYVFNFINNYEGICYFKNIAEHFQISSSDIENILNELKNEKRIKYVNYNGGGKYGFIRIINENK